MTPAELKHARRHIREESATYPMRMKEVPREAWAMLEHTGIVAVWRSRHFMVQAYQKIGMPLRLTLQRSALNDDGTWKDGITWDDIQRIKSECGFAHTCAIEIYPPDADLVNVANLRHIWLVESPFSCGRSHDHRPR